VGGYMWVWVWVWACVCGRARVCVSHAWAHPSPPCSLPQDPTGATGPAAFARRAAEAAAAGAAGAAAAVEAARARPVETAESRGGGDDNDDPRATARRALESAERASAAARGAAREAEVRASAAARRALASAGAPSPPSTAAARTVNPGHEDPPPPPPPPPSGTPHGAPGAGSFDPACLAARPGAALWNSDAPGTGTASSVVRPSAHKPNTGAGLGEGSGGAGPSAEMTALLARKGRAPRLMRSAATLGLRAAGATSTAYTPAPALARAAAATDSGGRVLRRVERRTDRRGDLPLPPAGGGAGGGGVAGRRSPLTPPLRLEVRSDQCPRAAENFLTLCAVGYYDNTAMHRSTPGLLGQAGARGGLFPCSFLSFLLSFFACVSSCLFCVVGAFIRLSVRPSLSVPPFLP